MDNCTSKNEVSQSEISELTTIWNERIWYNGPYPQTFLEDVEDKHPQYLEPIKEKLKNERITEIEANHQKRADQLCGTMRWINTLIGWKKIKYECGHCSECYSQNADKVLYKLDQIKAEGYRLNLYTVASNEERKKEKRRLKAAGVKCAIFPVEKDGQIVYNILVSSENGYKGEDVTETLSSTQVEEWMNLPAGEKRTLELVGGDIKKLPHPSQVEETVPDVYTTKKDEEAIEIIIPSCSLPADVRVNSIKLEYPVSTVEELQEALFDLRLKIQEYADKNNVVFRMKEHRKYIRKTTLPEVLEKFNSAYVRKYQLNREEPEVRQSQDILEMEQIWQRVKPELRKCRPV